MKFYSTYDVTGDVLFENDRWIVGYIKDGPFENIADPQSDVHSFLTALRRASVHTNGRISEFFAPRNPAFLAVSKVPFDYNLTDQDLSEIDQATVTASLGEPIHAFNQACKLAKGKGELDARVAFTAAHLKTGKLHYANTQLQPAGAIHFKSHGDTFEVSKVTGSSDVPTGVCFSNEFEMVYVPFDGNGDAESAIQRVLSRANLPGRVASDYIVIPVLWDEPQACIRVKQLDNMSTKEMLAFFGHNKKSTTKMETLSGCLGSWEKHVPFLEVGDVFFIQINTQAPETPIDVEPVDWVMARSSHFRIIHSDQPAPEAVDMYVEIVEEKTDEFASALYTMFEAQKQSINVIGVGKEKMDRMFQEIRNRVNAAAGA